MSTTGHRLPARTPESAGPRRLLLYPCALVIGLLGGALTSFGQGILEGGWHILVNSASTWVLVAFLIGLWVPGRWRSAALAGLVTEVGLVVGYYATSELRGFAAGMNAVLIWITAGLAAGPAHGAAGALLRSARGLVRTAVVGITGSIWLFEGAWTLWLAADANSNSGPGEIAGWSYIAVGVALPLILGRSMGERLRALPFTAAGAALALIAVLLVEAAFKI